MYTNLNEEEKASIRAFIESLPEDEFVKYLNHQDMYFSLIQDFQNAVIDILNKVIPDMFTLNFTGIPIRAEIILNDIDELNKDQYTILFTYFEKEDVLTTGPKSKLYTFNVMENDEARRNALLFMDMFSIILSNRDVFNELTECFRYYNKKYYRQQFMTSYAIDLNKRRHKPSIYSQLVLAC